ncbi:drought-induced 19 [Zea mays]|uniref:Drought-induced 19 n=1 Tax=Zea mays TaxID=4577 RepID=A0A1D6H7M5_MAIZE|nr:drought-induced 19 [Zea mays]
MDSDLWISRLTAAKRQFALQRAQRQHAAPASHHVIVIYFLNDVHLQKHQRVRRVTGNGNHNLSYAGRDLQLQETYLKVLLGNSSRSSSTNASSTVTDSLLPSLVLNLSSPEVEDASKFSAPAVVENNWFKRSLPSKTWKLRTVDSTLSHEERERRRRRAAVRSAFVQHLLVTTIFED